MWWGVRDSVCVSAKVRGKGSERGRESSSANTGHEKCMEVVVSVCWSESCRKKKRAETGFSELCNSRCLDSHSPSQPASAFHTLQLTSLVLLASQPHALYTRFRFHCVVGACCKYTFSSPQFNLYGAVPTCLIYNTKRKRYCLLSVGIHWNSTSVLPALKGYRSIDQLLNTRKREIQSFI